MVSCGSDSSGQAAWALPSRLSLLKYWSAKYLSERRTIPLSLLASHGETACRWASLSPDRLVGERVPNFPYVHSLIYSLADFRSNLASRSVLGAQHIRTRRPIHMVWESWSCLAISVASSWWSLVLLNAVQSTPCTRLGSKRRHLKSPGPLHPVYPWWLSCSRHNVGACGNLLCPHLLTVYQIIRRIGLVCGYCQADFSGGTTP